MTTNEPLVGDKNRPQGSGTGPANPQIGGAKPDPGAKIEIASDEDWKQRVKTEAAALDQQFREQPAASPSATAPSSAQAATPASPETAQSAPAAPTERPPQSSDRSPRSRPAPELPEATFTELIGMLSAQAMVGLGVIKTPATQKAEPQLPLARYFIDLLTVLEEKTTGQLTNDEAALLEETLHSLRLAFTQLSK